MPAVQFVRASSGQPTAALLSGNGVQATFQNTTGSVIVVTSHTADTVTIPIDASGNPIIPPGAAVTTDSNPSSPATSPSGVNCNPNTVCVLRPTYLSE